jgi:hypothetical protein
MREYLSKTNTFRKITGILLPYHWLNTTSIGNEIVKKKKGFPWLVYGMVGLGRFMSFFAK